MKLVFLTHEFGLFKGHGGVASYLYNLCKVILDESSHQITVFACAYDKSCDLLGNPRFSIETLVSDEWVYARLIDLDPDYVEAPDYCAFGLYSLIQKRLHGTLKNTVFAVHHHSASRECFEWNSGIPVKFANNFVRESFEKEKAQILLADVQVAPSIFMADYVKRNYLINDKVNVFPHPSLSNLENKSELAPYKDFYDIESYAQSFNILAISRLEGRKNQARLIDQFIKFKNKYQISANLFLVGNANRDEITGEDFAYKLFKSVPIEERKYIHFCGYLPLEKQKPFILLADLAVLPSTFETFSIALGELAQRGVPCVASTYSGCCDYFGSTARNMTFNPFVQDSLYRVICDFYELTADQKEAIAKEQENEFKKLTSVNNAVTKRLKFISDCVKDNTRIQLDLRKNRSNKNLKLVIEMSKTKDLIFEQGDYYVLVSCVEDKREVCEFIYNFKFNQNLSDKIIVLNDRVDLLVDAQDVVTRGLPVIFPKVLINSDRQNENSQFVDMRVLLSLLVNRFEKVVQIRALKSLSHYMFKKQTDFTFVEQNKINFQSRVL